MCTLASGPHLPCVGGASALLSVCEPSCQAPQVEKGVLLSDGAGGAGQLWVLAQQLGSVTRVSISSLVRMPASGPQPPILCQTLVNMFFPEAQHSFGSDAPERSELGWMTW